MKRSELKQLIRSVIEESTGGVVSLQELQADVEALNVMMGKYRGKTIAGFDETGDDIYESLSAAAQEMMDFIIEGSEDEYEGFEEDE